MHTLLIAQHGAEEDIFLSPDEDPVVPEEAMIHCIEMDSDTLASALACLQAGLSIETFETISELKHEDIFSYPNTMSGYNERQRFATYGW